MWRCEMSLELQSVSDGDLGSLQGCLVEGDPAQRKRERSIRRRALIVSVVLQSAGLALLVLLPLFGKPASLANIVPPIPIYRSVGEPVHRNRTPEPPRRTNRPATCRFCPPTHIPPRIVTVDDAPIEPDPSRLGSPNGTGQPACPTCIDIPGLEANRIPPAPVTHTATRRLVTRIDPAMLIHRVEPAFPPLARQIRKGGHVELRAIIATDGTIQSLQIVSGDPLFYQSAMEAVRQWRYRPTVLNGQPVEIDTFITVIYTVQ